ncbi:oligosaccharide flippase family protein [Microbacterium sp. DT81.1]|uniref:oligosaccharide flippase family protein n=1 Tax=Microbacterium sp. DT81.1 TaxID=3393413 RepID=UPI003CF0D567
MSRSRLLPQARRLGGDAALVSVGQIFSYAYPLVSLPLLSRTLGVEGLGVFATILVIIQLLHVWTDFGFGFSALQRMSTAGSREGRQAVAAATITAKLALWASGSIVVMIVAFTVPSLRDYGWYVMIGVLASIGVALYPMWYLQATGQFRLLASLTAGSRLLALAGLVLTVRSPAQFGLAVFWQFVPFLLCAIVSWAVLIPQGDIRLRLSRPAGAVDALRDSLPLFVNLISGQFIVISSVLLLSQVSGYRQAGLFTPADRLVSAIHGVLVAVEQAMLPRLSADRRPEEPNQRKLIFGGLICCYTVSGITLAVIAPVLIPWYLGDEFSEAVPVVQIMGLAVVLSGIARTLVLHLVSLGRFTASSVVIAMAAVWHVATAAFAASVWGAIGVAVAVCGTQLFMAVGLWIVIARRRIATSPSSKTRRLEGRDQMGISFVWEAIRGRIALFVITVIVVTGGGIALGAIWPKTYTSSAQILLGVRTSGTTIDVQSATLYLRERVATYAQIVKADEIIDPAAEATESSPDALRRAVSVGIIPETVVLEISASGASPDQAVERVDVVSARFRAQLSALNVRTGGPRLVAAEVSSPQPATVPDQLHGTTLYVVSAFVGLLVAVVLTTLVAVIRGPRRRRREEPSRLTSQESEYELLDSAMR